MTQETEQDRLKRAFADGRRQAEVDGRLDGHEARLNAINGSIERGTRATAGLAQGVEGLHEKMAELAAAQRERAAVEAARAEELRKANEKQISSRTFWSGVVMIVVVLVLGLMANAHVFSGAIFGGLL